MSNRREIEREKREGKKKRGKGVREKEREEGREGERLFGNFSGKKTPNFYFLPKLST
jgi:hypothetical protein